MSVSILVLESVILLILLVCSAFFSSSETCLFSLNTIDIDRLKSRRAAAAARIERLLA